MTEARTTEQQVRMDWFHGYMAGLNGRDSAPLYGELESYLRGFEAGSRQAAQANAVRAALA